MQIRHATPHDIPPLVPLLAELGYPTHLNELTERLELFLKNPGYGVIVCEVETRVVGFLAWSRSSLFVSDTTRLHIEGVVTDPDYRRQGVGRKLLEFVEDIARASGASIVDLTSGVRRASKGIHQFYEGLGYKNEGEMAKLYLRKVL